MSKTRLRWPRNEALPEVPEATKRKKKQGWSKKTQVQYRGNGDAIFLQFGRSMVLSNPDPTVAPSAARSGPVIGRPVWPCTLRPRWGAGILRPLLVARGTKYRYIRAYRPLHHVKHAEVMRRHRFEGGESVLLSLVLGMWLLKKEQRDNKLMIWWREFFGLNRQEARPQ